MISTIAAVITFLVILGLYLFRRRDTQTLSISASAQPARPDWKRKRAAPSKRPGSTPPRMHDEITWTRNVYPREVYRIVYVDRGDQRSERTIELQKLGELKGTPYLGVMHQGKFKTLRASGVADVLEQVTMGHEPSIRAWRQIGYSSELPPFPVEHALHKVPSIANPRRHWTVDLNAYTCTCPEKRIRSGFGYGPGSVGMVCPHMARAICDHLPANLDAASGWSQELLLFLRDPRRVHIDNLI